MDDMVYVKAAACLGSALAIGIGTIGPAFGLGMIGSKACENIAKNPENAGLISKTMFLAMALTETPALYALVIALLLVFKA
jgi:F-type H+-transporting ATPase subunit c